MSIERICSSTCNCSWRNLSMDVFRVCCFPNLLRQFKFLSLVRNGFRKEIPDRMEEMKAAPSLSQHLPWRQKIVIFSSLKLLKFIMYVVGADYMWLKWFYTFSMTQGPFSVALSWKRIWSSNRLWFNRKPTQELYLLVSTPVPTYIINLQSCLQLPHQNVSRQLPFAITSENRDAMIGLRFS